MNTNRDLVNEPFTLEEIKDACSVVHRVVQPTPQIDWPLLSERVGCRVFVKHENHLPTGAFKLRGGILLTDYLQAQDGLDFHGLVAATRGNHGQSVAYAARILDWPATIIVPKGNNKEKNNAMRALGAKLIIKGADFDEALEVASQLAQKKNLFFVPSFHWQLVLGVATYAYELFTSVPDLSTVYVPIGLGSGIAGMIAVRDALQLNTKVVGVVSKNANTYRLSFDAGKPVPTDAAVTLADGLAVRRPSHDALEIINKGAAKIIEVSEDELKDSIRILLSDTHNLAEGAGAAALAGLLKEKESECGKRVAIVLSGGNIDSASLMDVLKA